MLLVTLPAWAGACDELDVCETEWQPAFDEHQRWEPPPPPIILATQPSHTHSYRGMGDDVERWRSLVTSYWADDTDRALCLMGYESGGNPDAKNPRSSARGLFQIMAHIWAPHFGVSYDQLYDPEINTRLAHQIYLIQGWQAWSPYNRGLCR